MGQVGSKLRSVQGGYAHYCPACRTMHEIRTRAPFELSPGWSFDMNFEHPSFHPSLNINGPVRCHYTVVSGYLHFANDCGHGFANQVVEMPDLPNYVRDVQTA